MSKDVRLEGVEFQNPETLSVAAKLLNLELQENVDIRYFGGATKKHSYGIKLGDDCPYDIGFEPKKIKNKQGKWVNVLEVCGDSEFLQVTDENSYYFEKSKAGLNKVGLGCDTLQQAYSIATLFDVAEFHNLAYESVVLPDRTLVMTIEMGN